MYKILIVSALSRELNVVKEEIKKLGLQNVKTSFLTTWMWNYNMILNLTRFLENHEVDLVINIWVCWYSPPSNSPLAGGEKNFQVARILNISNNKELIVPKIIDFSKLESIACSEKPVYDQEEIWEEKFVDMESYWFEKVCDSFSVARLILKVPVDKIGEETQNFDFKKAENSLRNSIDYKELFWKINDYLENHFNVWKGKYKFHHDLFETYEDRFKFSFSEKEIFKRLYFRYIALVNNDFDKYYIENKDKNKKDFLKWLENFLDDYLVR